MLTYGLLRAVPHVGTRMRSCQLAVFTRAASDPRSSSTGLAIPAVGTGAPLSCSRFPMHRCSMPMPSSLLRPEQLAWLMVMRSGWPRCLVIVVMCGRNGSPELVRYHRWVGCWTVGTSRPLAAWIGPGCRITTGIVVLLVIGGLGAFGADRYLDSQDITGGRAGYARCVGQLACIDPACASFRR